MNRPRYAWVSLTALVAYLAIHLGVAALHHHHAERSGSAAAAVGCPEVASAPADEDDGDEHSCPICHVLHLAQHVGLVAPTVTAVAATGDAVTPPAVAHPHLLETSTHARAPPAV
jgi:hypothetical protein